MKVNKSFLKQVIREELDSLMEVIHGPVDRSGEYTGDEYIDDFESDYVEPQKPSNVVPIRQQQQHQQQSDQIQDYIYNLRNNPKAESIAYRILKAAGRDPVLGKSMILLGTPMMMNNKDIRAVVLKMLNNK